MAMDAEEVKRSLDEAIGTLRNELDGEIFVATVQEMLTVCQRIVQDPSDRSRRKVPKGSVPLVDRNDAAKVMFYVVGFEEGSDDLQLSDGASLVNVGVLTGILQEAVQRAGLVSQMASGGSRIEPRVRTYNSSESVESGDPLTVVAHLSYHYFMRWFLITTNVSPPMVVSFGSQVRVSMNGIEMATRTLGIMKPDSAAFATWTALKRDVLQQLQEAQNVTGIQNKAEMVNTMLGCASDILEELKRNSPQVCITMFYYMHLTKMIMMVTSAGHMVSREDANRYIQSSFDLPTDRFSKEYRDSIDKVRGFCLKMQETELVPDELAELHQTVTWQSNEFLEHFQSLSEPSLESGLPRCPNAPPATMSSQFSSVLSESSSKSSSETGGYTLGSLPTANASGVGVGVGGGSGLQGPESSDQAQLQDLHMAWQMQVDDLKDKLPSQNAEQLQAMMSHTDAAFDRAHDRVATSGGDMPSHGMSGFTLGADTASGSAPSTVMPLGKNHPDYRSLAPIVSNDPDDDAALDRDLYDSDVELDITEKDDYETEKEKKVNDDEKEVDEQSSPTELARQAPTTPHQQPVHVSQSPQQHVSIQSQGHIAEATTSQEQSQVQQLEQQPKPQDQRQHVAQVQSQLQPQIQLQPQLQSQHSPQHLPPYQPQHSRTPGDQAPKNEEQGRKRELTKAAQAALARLEKMQQRQSSQQQQGTSTNPVSQERTTTAVNQQQSTATPSQSTESHGMLVNASGKPQVTPTGGTGHSSPSGNAAKSYSPHSRAAVSQLGEATKQSPAASQTPAWQGAQTKPSDTATRLLSATPSDPKTGSRQGQQVQSQMPDNQPLATPELQARTALSNPLMQSSAQIPVIDSQHPSPSKPSTSTPVSQSVSQPSLGQPRIQKPQTSTALASVVPGQSLGFPSSARPRMPLGTPSVARQPQLTSSPGSSVSSTPGNQVQVRIANPHTRQPSRQSAIPEQFRSMSVMRLPQLVQAVKDDTDAEEALKILNGMKETREETLAVKENEQKVLQEHVSKHKSAVVAHTLQKALDKKSEEVEDLHEELRRIAEAKAKAEEILRSAREVELTALDPEFLYGILESFLKRIENDHDTMVKVLKSWLDYAPRQVLVEICDRLEIEREGDDPRIWVQKIREREQELEEGQLAD